MASFKKKNYVYSVHGKGKISSFEMVFEGKDNERSALDFYREMFLNMIEPRHEFDIEWIELFRWDADDKELKQEVLVSKSRGTAPK
jgi:hypothetical protein